jgi:hypothetical protein
MSFSLPAEAKILDIDKISLYRDSSGILRVKIEGEAQEYPVKPIRYFPFTEDEYYVGLFKIEPNGTIAKEIALISDLKRLDEKSRKLVEEELNKSFPLSQVTKITSIKQVGKNLRWQVRTIEGERTFEVSNQNDINIISPSLVAIKDANGKKYKINLTKLDPDSQSLLEAYI